MSKQILILATARNNIVIFIAEKLLKEGCALSLMVRRERRKELEHKLPGCRFIEYDAEQLKPWCIEEEHLIRLRPMARDGVVYICPRVQGYKYENVELFARQLNPGQVQAITFKGSWTSILLPRKALRLLQENKRDELASYIQQSQDRTDIKQLSSSLEMGWGPYEAIVSLASTCNYRCIMCMYYSDFAEKEFKQAVRGYGHFKTPRDVEKKLELDDHLALFEQLADLETASITFSGAGESLMNPHLKEIIFDLSKKSFLWRLITNGLLLKPDKRQCLCAGNNGEVQISLNAASPETFSRIHCIKPESFYDVVDNIKALANEMNQSGNNNTMTVSFVIHKWNIHEVGAMLELVCDCGANVVYMTPMFLFHLKGEQLHLDSSDITIIDHHIAQFRERHSGQDVPEIRFSKEIWIAARNGTRKSYEKFPCYMGWYMTRVYHNGDVVACCMCNHCMGNILEEPFSEIWNGPRYMDVRKKMLALPQTQKTIEQCQCFECIHTPHNRAIHYGLPIDGQVFA